MRENSWFLNLKSEKKILNTFLNRVLQKTPLVNLKNASREIIYEFGRVK